MRCMSCHRGNRSLVKDRPIIVKPVPHWRVAAYQLFEAADASWQLVIGFVFFSLYVEHVLHRPAVDYGWALSAAALVAALLWPVLGAVTDIVGPRKPMLRSFVAFATSLTAVIPWLTHPWAAIMVFSCAMICVNGAFNFYAALLPEVARGRDVSAVVTGSLAMGFGGSLAALMFIGSLVAIESDAGRVFLPMALLYLSLALPCIFLSPDVPITAERATFSLALHRVRRTLSGIRHHANLARFLCAFTLMWSACLAVPAFIGLYVRNIVGVSAEELPLLYAPAIASGAIGTLTLYRFMISRVGPRGTFAFVILVWALFFVLFFLPPERWLFLYFAGPLIGLGTAGMQAAGRTLLANLTPNGQSGETWGIFGFCDRLANVIGNITWTAALTLSGSSLPGYRMAALAMASLMAAGVLVLFWKKPATP